MRPFDRFVAAHRQTVQAILAIGVQLTDADWVAPTECPLWSVGDIYAHLVTGEAWVTDWSSPPDDFLGWINADVVAQRGRPRAAVVRQLRQVYAAGRAFLADADPDAPATYPWGTTTTVTGLVQTRVFDTWLHEQDIRRATALPGNLGSPAAGVVAEIFAGRLPRTLARQAEVPRGSTVRFTVTGDVPIDVAVRVDEDGRGVPVPADGSPPTTQLRMDWESFARLAAGRGTWTDHPVEVAGDTDLAAQVLSRMSMTP